MHSSILQRKIWWTTVEASFVVLASIVRMRRNIVQMMCWSTHLIKHGFKEDYRCWNKHGDIRLNEAEMREEVPTDGVEEEDDDVNETDILRLSDEDIVSRVDNIEEMVRNIERHTDDDQYSNDELTKYKKIIKDFNKSFYDGCAVQYMILFVMVKLFQLKASNRWSDGSFKNLLTLLKGILPQGNSVPEIVYEAKQIIYPLGLEVKKIHVCKNDCILYRGEEYEDLEKCTTYELDRFNRRKDSGDYDNYNRRKGELKNMFWYFTIIPHLKRWFTNKKGVRIITMA
jgi:hypothetical protein